MNRSLLGPEFENPKQLSVVDSSVGSKFEKDVDVYTCVKLTSKGWSWYQEADDKILLTVMVKLQRTRAPGSLSAL